MHILTHRGAIRFALAASAVLAAGCLATLLQAAEPKAAAKPKPPEKKLTGAELYAIHCNRCHAERYPTEFTAREWQTIMAQMRVRANLPAAQAKEILNYLKDESGNP